MPQPDGERPFCSSGKHLIAIDVARIVDERGIICVECLAFDNRLTANDRKFLRSLRIESGGSTRR